MNPRLKKIIFDKLNEDLSTVEIIVAENKSIWFIDRANKYWYFELEKSGKLWWRYEFFIDFFILFSLKTDEFQPLLSEWVEGVLNCRVSATLFGRLGIFSAVEGVLNCRVSATIGDHAIALNQVEGVLNQGIVTSVEVGLAGSGVTEGILRHGYRKGSRKVEEVLNHLEDTNIAGGYNKPRQVDKVLNRKINKIDGGELFDESKVEQILGHKVVSISHASEKNEFVQQAILNELISNLPRAYGTENPLGYVVESATPLDTPAYGSVDEVLSYKVNRTIPDMSESLVEVQRLLDSNQ
jgi:hypothetical protein